MNTINPEWIAYNNINNEGGEGFNPHSKYVEAENGEPLWSILEGKQYRLKRIKNGTPTGSDRYEELEKEISELGVAIEIAKNK